MDESASQQTSTFRRVGVAVAAAVVGVIDFVGGFLWLPEPEGTGVIPHPGFVVALLTIGLLAASPFVGIALRSATKNLQPMSGVEATVWSFIGLSGLLWLWVLTWDL